MQETKVAASLVLIEVHNFSRGEGENTLAYMYQERPRGICLKCEVFTAKCQSTQSRTLQALKG